MNEIKDTGMYVIPSQFDGAGDEITFEFTFPEYTDVEDAIKSVGPVRALHLINKSAKTNARNDASASAKSANGHSTRPVLTAEQKAENKVARANLSAIAKVIAEKGLSLEDIKAL